MAIEIVSFPIKNGGSFHSYVSLPEGNPPKDGGFILHPPSCKDVPSSPRCARASKGCSPWSDRSGSTSPGGRSAGWHVVGYYSWWTHTYIHIYIFIICFYYIIIYYIQYIIYWPYRNHSIFSVGWCLVTTSRRCWLRTTPMLVRNPSGSKNWKPSLKNGKVCQKGALWFVGKKITLILANFMVFIPWVSWGFPPHQP